MRSAITPVTLILSLKKKKRSISSEKEKANQASPQENVVKLWEIGLPCNQLTRNMFHDIYLLCIATLQGT